MTLSLVFHMNIASDLKLRLGKGASAVALVRFFGREVNFRITSSHYAVEQSKTAPGRIVEKRLLPSISEDSKTRGINGLRSTDVRHRVARDEI